jgi:hypothetical protein
MKVFAAGRRSVCGNRARLPARHLVTKTKRSAGLQSGVPNDRSSSLGWESGVPNDRSSSLGWESGVPNDRSSSLGWEAGYRAGVHTRTSGALFLADRAPDHLPSFSASEPTENFQEANFAGLIQIGGNFRIDDHTAEAVFSAVSTHHAGYRSRHYPKRYFSGKRRASDASMPR